MIDFKRILFFLLFCLPFALFSGNKDSIQLFKDNGITKYCSAEGFECGADSLMDVDNSLTGFQNYFERNNLGNIGLPINDFTYSSFENSEVGFNYWKNNYKSYFFLPKNMKFYNTRSPFTDLFYVAGSKKEGVFKMTFSYNIKKNWNVTVNFSRVRSEGFYKREKTLDNFIGLSSNYKSLNNRYWLLVSAGFNSMKNEENGGVANDSDFVQAGATDRQLITMNLQSAKRSVVSTSASVQQFLNFGRKSTDTTTSGRIIPGSRLILTSTYDNYALKYEDDYPATGFYKNIYYDSTKTFDTTFTYKLANELDWKRVDNGKHRGVLDMFGISVGVKDEMVRVKQHQIIDTSFNNVMVSGGIYNTYSNHSFWWKAAGKYVLSGYNGGDYNAGLVLKKMMPDSLVVVSLNGSVRESAPDFIYNRYVSNNFKWTNNFDKTGEWRVGGNLGINKIKLLVGADYKVLTNVLYFDNYAIARQYKGEVSVFSAFIKKDFKIAHWHLDNLMRYQYVPDSMVIRVPAFVLEHSLYYSADNLFKGALKLQIGVNVFYSSAYYANAYMPATGEFYLQSEKKYGDYPFIDFFLNAKIKSVRVFVKIDHLNSGMMGNNYMLTPHYAYNDRMFKVGVSWRFWD